MKILILGANGFIGNALTERILHTTSWQVAGMDLAANKLMHSLNHPRFEFIEGDIMIHREWVEYHVKKADVVLPLVAIATPASYVRDPLGVFELDFEENLRIVRLCVRYRKRLVFPSTSEVYGMCDDPEFGELDSPLVCGPVHKSRWIYSCSKQLLDRVICGYGQQHGLRYTCVRPFNWIGPKLDDINAAKEGSSRVITQFIASLLSGEGLDLVDGGLQRRCFTYLDDGIDALMTILHNAGGCAEGRIFNLGNPANECSIRELAMKLIALYRRRCAGEPDFVEPDLRIVAGDSYYGAGYQDIVARKPSIAAARAHLGWEPKVGLDDAIARTFEAFLAEWRQARPASRAIA